MDLNTKVDLLWSLTNRIILNSPSHWVEQTVHSYRVASLVRVEAERDAWPSGSWHTTPCLMPTRDYAHLMPIVRGEWGSALNHQLPKPASTISFSFLKSTQCSQRARWWQAGGWESKQAREWQWPTLLSQAAELLSWPRQPEDERGILSLPGNKHRDGHCSPSCCLPHRVSPMLKLALSLNMFPER